ncbi:MAG TPA: glycosyltransferase [Clostridia bacterium]|nr:glycosyltransferase [Clostridia bacterium]
MQIDIKPCVSVIIPSYNHQNYIRAAIQSVLDQSFSNYELLIADDASSDDSWSVIKSFKDERITSYRFDINMGAAEATNFLITKATGKYIALLNSDDYWHKDKLKLQYDFMEQNPEYAACFTNVCLVDENGLTLKRNKNQWENMFKNSNLDRGEWLERFFFNLNSLCHPSIMIKREVYTLTGLYNPCYVQLPDFNMWIKLLKLASIYVIEIDLTFFRIISGAKNTSSVTFDNIQRHDLELELILENFFDDMPDGVFLEGFSKYLKKKGDLSKAELNCEKTFIYFDIEGKRKSIYSSVGIRRLYRLLSDENTAEALMKSYNFTHKDFRELKNENELLLERFVANAKSILRRNSFLSNLVYKIIRRKDV